MYEFTTIRTYRLVISLCLIYIILKLYTSLTSVRTSTSVVKIVNVTKDNNRQVLINPEISCHYSSLYDMLPSAEDPSFSPGDQPIFFHETSCRGGITNREACAIESAARLHPKRQINLLFSSSVTKFRLNNSNLVHLLKIKNIKIYRLHVDKYAEGSVVDLTLRTRIKKSAYPVEHMSEILRMVTLNKFGGVYLDKDSFLIRNLDLLPPNWIAKESNMSISASAMGFSFDGLGHHLTSAILDELRHTYSPKSWYQNGANAIQRVLNKICPNVVLKNGDCGGLKIFSPKHFYPIHYGYSWEYFQNHPLDNLYKSYMHHMWNSRTQKLKIEMFSPYAILAEKYCPTIFRIYSKEFGTVSSSPCCSITLKLNKEELRRTINSFSIFLEVPEIILILKCTRTCMRLDVFTVSPIRKLMKL